MRTSFTTCTKYLFGPRYTLARLVSIAVVLKGKLLSVTPLSLNDLSRSAGLDKSQASRVVSGLIERGLVARMADDSDGRGISLSLTKAGKRVYRGLTEAASERDAAFRNCLSSAECAALMRALDKIATEARGFIEAETVVDPRRISKGGK